MAGSSTEPKSYTRLTSSQSCPSCVGMERECCDLERARDELQSAMEEQIADGTPRKQLMPQLQLLMPQLQLLMSQL